MNPENERIRHALEQLSTRNAVLEELVRSHGPYTPRRTETPDVFGSLAKTIIYQQLAGRGRCHNPRTLCRTSPEQGVACSCSCAQSRRPPIGRTVSSQGRCSSGPREPRRGGTTRPRRPRVPRRRGTHQTPVQGERSRSLDSPNVPPVSAWPARCLAHRGPCCAKGFCPGLWTSQSTICPRTAAFGGPISTLPLHRGLVLLEGAGHSGSKRALGSPQRHLSRTHPRARFG